MSPRIVMITGDGPEHVYVTNEICRAVEVAAILVTEQPAPRSWRTVLKKSLGEFADKALWRLYLRMVGDRAERERQIARVLGPAGSFDAADKVSRVGRPKAGRLRREVEALAPDYLVIYGTSMIPNSVLRLAGIRAFNMHTGVSPHYRGAACAFWPIHEGDPDNVGATVHECTAEVDGGEIYRVVRAQVYRGDGLHAIFARAVQAGAVAYVEVLREALAGRLAGEPQDLTEGREFRGYMRGIRAELTARRRLRHLQRRLPAAAD
jgi:methionyl-tRNA formyltransferase